MPPGPVLAAIHSLMTTGSGAPGPVLVTVMVSRVEGSGDPWRSTPCTVRVVAPVARGTATVHAVRLVQVTGRVTPLI